MKHLNEYIEENTIDYRIDEGFFSNLFAKLGAFLTKKFGVSEDESKKLNDTINKENESLNSEISKLTKGRVKDLITWWKIYIKQNSNASKVKSPMIYNQTILRNTGNVTLVFKKMIDSYKAAGILSNNVICLFIKCCVNQYIAIIESIISNNNEKVNLANQLTKLYTIIEDIDIPDGENADTSKEAINDAAKALDGKGKELLLKYKK